MQMFCYTEFQNQKVNQHTKHYKLLGKASHEPVRRAEEEQGWTNTGVGH